ncbi:class I SAM-dependent methyltransferase [Thermodesulfobacteriota bacterium]
MKKDMPSRTAVKVALSIVTLGAKPGMDKVLPSGLVEATQKLLVASGAIRPRTARLAASPRMIAVYEAFDWMLPGQFEAFAQRKAFCENQVRDGIGAGVEQILVLGAGYDTLGWRLGPEFPGVGFFEIDHPTTAAFKTKGITAMGQPDNLHLISEDLGKRNLGAVLGSHASWDRTLKTVIVAEGLLMYLHPDSVRELFIRCASVVGACSRFAFSYIPSGPDGRPDAGPWTGYMLWLQKMVGEPWLWSIRSEELGSFLVETGWRAAPEINTATGKCGVEYLVAALKDG